MNGNRKREKKQAAINNSSINVLSREEIRKKISGIQAEMKAYTWRELETRGKFDKNAKISFISDDMLILGCDIGSDTHYARAIDSRGRELSKGAFAFHNSSEGFGNMKSWALELAARNDKRQIVLGLEPTGHYWYCTAAWMVANGISVVQVNPHAVRRTKEVEDNSQEKNDRKDPKVIANLVKDGNYGMPYLPEGLYAELRKLSMLKDQLTEDRIRSINRLHREMKIYFPEYKDAFGKVDGLFCMEILKKAPFPEDILELGEEGLRNIWKEARLKGCGYSKAGRIVRYAEDSVGLKEGLGSAREAVRWFAEEAMRLKEKLDGIEEMLHRKCRQIPYAVNLLEISGIGEDILSGIVSDMGDITRFDDPGEIQKISGFSLVACSSGKHKGETKISHRGRKRLRYWLFLAARSAVVHAGEFKVLHEYYTTRAENPLKRMQSLIVIACKILRIIYAILKTGTRYDPEKMLRDIKKPQEKAARAA